MVPGLRGPVDVAREADVLDAVVVGCLEALAGPEVPAADLVGLGPSLLRPRVFVGGGGRGWLAGSKQGQEVDPEAVEVTEVTAADNEVQGILSTTFVVRFKFRVADSEEFPEGTKRVTT